VTDGSGGAPGTVLQGGREKAYRPLSVEERDLAFARGVAAYERGDFFEAHEHLEPAWMGTADPAERNLHQGLIKLAAAFVHAVRGNPLGVEKNLRGARERLADALVDDVDDRGLDLRAILRDVDGRLAELVASPTRLRVDQVPLHRRRTE
jgi:predicted metal-dependent hydrolase